MIPIFMVRVPFLLASAKAKQDVVAVLVLRPRAIVGVDETVANVLLRECLRVVSSDKARADIDLKVASAFKAALAKVLAIADLERTACPQLLDHFRYGHGLYFFFQFNFHFLSFPAFACFGLRHNFIILLAVCQ